MTENKSGPVTRRNLAKHTFEMREEQIIRDPLTGVYNRRYFDRKLDELTGKESNEPFAVILFDIDRFKNVNDTYGHPTGDTVLKEFVGILNSSIRVGLSDTVGRLGGEEFGILMNPAKNVETAFELAERIRKKVENYNFRIPQGTIKITTSAGVGIWDQRETKDELFERVDIGLYTAKNTNGRNNVVKVV